MNDPLSEGALDRLLDMAQHGDDEPAAPLLPPRYELRGVLGRGGMGVVHEAYDRQLDRLCAVKIVAGADEVLRRRLQREALTAARLRHPHIAAVYDATADYISMQRIVGVPLDAIDPGERRLLVELLRDAARAVHHAHQQGIVHRDLKPSNLLVEGHHVFVLDFGLAKQLDVGNSLSLAGAVLGTPAFMPPEQALGRHDAVDARSDVYGLGATLYRCLTGRMPFAAADLPQLLQAVVELDAAPAGIDRDLDLVLAKCLAKEPTQRYPDAAALADDLDRWLTGRPVAARRPSLAYRLRKLLQRRRSALRFAGIAALLAVGATALVLVPLMLRESAGRVAASEAVALSEHATAVLQDAAVYTRLGDLPSAHMTLDGGIQRAREFLSRHDVPRVHHLLSRLLRARDNPVGALAELEIAIAGDPTLVEARFERGLLQARGQLDPATRAQVIEDLGLELPPGSVVGDLERQFGRAERLRLAGEIDAAQDALEEVLTYDPFHVAARISLGLLMLERGDAQRALYYSSSAVDLQQGYGPVYVAREQQRLPTRIAGAAGLLVDFADQHGDDPIYVLGLAHRGLVLLRRGLRLEREGNLAAATTALRAAVSDHDQVLTMNERLGGARNNRAVCLFELRRLLAAQGDVAGAGDCNARARDDLTRAREIAAEVPEAHFNLALLARHDAEVACAAGRLQTARDRFGDARAALQTALTTAGGDWQHQATCRRLLGAVEAAAARLVD